MKIRILDADIMAVNTRYKDGDIVEVFLNSCGEFEEHTVRTDVCPFIFLIDWKDKYFEVVEGERPLKDPCKIIRNNKSTYDQYSPGNILYKQLQQLSELENAIERHDNKQNKRRSERQKLLEKIGRGLPKGVKIGTNEMLKPF